MCNKDFIVIYIYYNKILETISKVEAWLHRVIYLNTVYAHHKKELALCVLLYNTHTQYFVT